MRKLLVRQRVSLHEPEDRVAEEIGVVPVVVAPLHLIEIRGEVLQ